MRFVFRRLLPVLLVVAGARAQAGLMDNFIDPEDGWFDASSWLLDNPYGFLPVPVIVTEPAVGVGGGLAVAFFHETEEEKAARRKRASGGSGEFMPPSVSVAVGLYTESDSWVVGGGHIGHWKDDSIRYTGLGGVANINIDFYGVGQDSSEPLKLNIDAGMILNDIKFRLGESDFFLGGEYSIAKVKTGFDLGLGGIGIGPLELEFVDAGLGVNAEYDTADNPYAPTKGIELEWSAILNGESVGGDFNYREYQLDNHFYFPLAKKWTAGFRLDGHFTDGDVPFFSAPFIMLDGIPAMRYQDLKVLVGEVQLLYRIHRRFQLRAFTGAGRVAPDFDGLTDAVSREASGFGFRYTMIRALDLSTGIDVAFGPEDTVYYLKFGTAF